MYQLPMQSPGLNGPPEFHVSQVLLAQTQPNQHYQFVLSCPRSVLLLYTSPSQSIKPSHVYLIAARLEDVEGAKSTKRQRNARIPWDLGRRDEEYFCILRV
jgi:hypothetical protein